MELTLNFKFMDKRISGVLAVLPSRESRFVDEIEEYNFSRSQSMKLKLVMGYDKHRLADDSQCSSDLCIAGLEYLVENRMLNVDDVDALVVVTQSPDYIMPPTSSVIHGRMKMRKDTICFDVNQGCAGYIIGLIQSFMLLDQSEVNKVVLCNVDVLSKRVSSKDRNSYPLIGDGASITIVERSKTPSQIYCRTLVDGTRHDALMIPAGGFKIPSDPSTAKLVQDDKGNLRALDHLVMKGDDIFNFVQIEVPPLIENVVQMSGHTLADIESFAFHQPNKFMLNKLADNLGVPREKMPSNIVENFGNASSVTIPTVFAYNYSETLKENDKLMCLAGFGVGLTWGAMVMNVGKLDFCEIINV